MDTGSAVTLNFCAEGSDLELNYASGSFESENTYQLYDDQGNLVFQDGPTPATGLAFTYAVPLGAGNDCDDTDPNVGPEDLDGDGSSTCSGDCDDNDPSVFGYDIDGDGYTTCEGDCNESLDDLDNDGVADGFAINPDAVEIYGDELTRIVTASATTTQMATAMTASMMVVQTVMTQMRVLMVSMSTVMVLPPVLMSTRGFPIVMT